MSVLEALIAAWGGLASVGWCVYYLATLRSGFLLPWLARLRPRDPDRWPRLSVVVPACNEGGALREALDTLLAQDYPDLEIVLVDDRSTDSTGRIIDEAAARDDRIVAVHIRDLPEGWLGKVHALHSATQRARGEWILYTDADVHFRPGVLRKAVALCLERGLDHLAIGPELQASSFWLDVANAAFGTGFIFGTRAADATRHGSGAFVGVGAFNLVRRELLRRTPGFEWLRMEVMDDLGLGLMIKRAGGKSLLALGPGQIDLRWYDSIAAMVRGLEKNVFAGAAGYSVTRAALLVAVMVGLVFGPVVALLQGWPSVRLLGVAALAALLSFAVAARLVAGQRLLPLLMMPVGQLMLAWIVIRSAVVCGLRGGVAWRGTTYDLKRLREGQRVRF